MPTLHTSSLHTEEGYVYITSTLDHRAYGAGVFDRLSVVQLLSGARQWRGSAQSRQWQCRRRKCLAQLRLRPILAGHSRRHPQGYAADSIGAAPDRLRAPTGDTAGAIAA